MVAGGAEVASLDEVVSLVEQGGGEVVSPEDFVSTFCSFSMKKNKRCENSWNCHHLPWNLHKSKGICESLTLTLESTIIGYGTNKELSTFVQNLHYFT